MLTTSQSNAPSSLMTEHEVARFFNVSLTTIRRRRLLRQPPEWIKIGASVRYRSEAIQRFVEDNLQALKEGGK